MRDDKITFSYRDDDFNSEGTLLNFELLPDYKEKCDKEGNIIVTDEYKEYRAKEKKNELLTKFTKYQFHEELWENMDRLSPNQQKALTLLVSGKNIREIARDCNINEATIYRWLQLEIFINTLKLWQKNLMIETDLKVKSLVAKAFSRLEFVLDHPQKFDSKDYIRAIELSLSFMNIGGGKKQ